MLNWGQYYAFLLDVPYKRETFKGENFRKLVKNMIFAEKTFADFSLVPRQRMPHSQILWRELLQIATKLQNLQSFLPHKFPAIRYV